MAVQTARESPLRVLRTIVIAWLLAGSMDIAAAIFLYAFPSGSKIVRLLQCIGRPDARAASHTG